MKPRLLVVELWGLGDLAIATPFLRIASSKFHVTLLAKPYAEQLRSRLWPEVEVRPFVAPWTSFRGKYRLLTWPWRRIMRLCGQLGRDRFDLGLSGRWDPRDHFLLAVARARERFGFPRLGSQLFLNHPLEYPGPRTHRYESWCALGEALGLALPGTGDQVTPALPRERHLILIHSGAAQPVRVWPLERYQGLAARLRQRGFVVQVICDPVQRDWWLQAGEKGVRAPATVTGLLEELDHAAAFIGNDSGPGHLAAVCGVPTFTIFGPQLPECFRPLHPASQWFDGKACPYKPCFDYCRFPTPHCLWNVSEVELWTFIEPFAARHVNAAV